jgi:hypothetical protein
MSYTKLWHKRLGHINNEKLKQLKDLNLVKGLSLKEITNSHLCKGFVEGKQHRQKFPKDGGKQTYSLIDIVHSNVFGPMQTKSLGEVSYIITFTYDFSRKMWSIS